MTGNQKLAAYAAVLAALVIGWIVAGRIGGSMPVAWAGACRTKDTRLAFTESQDSASTSIRKGGISYKPARGTPERLKLDPKAFLAVNDSMRLVAFCQDSLPLKPHL